MVEIKRRCPNTKSRTLNEALPLKHYRRRHNHPLPLTNPPLHAFLRKNNIHQALTTTNRLRHVPETTKFQFDPLTFIACSSSIRQVLLLFDPVFSSSSSSSPLSPAPATPDPTTTLRLTFLLYTTLLLLEHPLASKSSFLLLSQLRASLSTVPVPTSTSPSPLPFWIRLIAALASTHKVRQSPPRLPHGAVGEILFRAGSWG
ncbi:hypothetical protein K432DRAFT_208265 [Lepidopterella palustris CBS 459.81]|uniref:Uncharacterized protein n=1 Tax=Lepidopterella palustris CBS 459.81 TaxID=1314670 RepID=A0A8E2J9E2_9PEZI|nr:hypothetical protein K432DRAFT_208265 [Lepidopterella palustris CBS 459.81]